MNGVRVAVVGGFTAKFRKSFVAKLKARGASEVVRVIGDGKASAIPSNTQLVIIMADVISHTAFYHFKQRAEAIGSAFLVGSKDWARTEKMLRKEGWLNRNNKLRSPTGAAAKPKRRGGRRPSWPLSVALWVWDALQAGLLVKEIRDALPEQHRLGSHNSFQGTVTRLKTKALEQGEPLQWIISHYDEADAAKPAMPSFKEWLRLAAFRQSLRPDLPEKPPKPEPKQDAPKPKPAAKPPASKHKGEGDSDAVATIVLDDAVPKALVEAFKAATWAAEEDTIEIKLRVSVKALKELTVAALEHALK